ncbi:ER membrane glycoprotein subunit of the GPI transamidase complex-like protein [Marasmius tenuissimus]|nr:ER membrane glycoprotein subunit of the GPI transamidase complex-like protein [Marasmius tenuissimus]
MRLRNGLKADVNSLVALSFGIHILVYLLAFASSRLPLFDASPKTFHLSKYTQPLLRWDAFHFASIVEDGYIYENQWAFFPGVPFIMRHGQQVIEYLTGYSDLMLGGAILAMACDTTRTMYHLSLHHLGSQKLAYLATLLSLLPSSPATLRLAVYAEPFFTYFAYKGMLSCARSQYLMASLYFALAGTFRSNGMLLGGFLLWDLVVQPLFQTGKIHWRKSFYAIPLTSATFIPFIYHQFSGFIAFCTGPNTRPEEWCSKTVPLIYSHTQSKYWDVGFLRYWTVAQIPNFAIAAPPLITITSYAVYVLKMQFGRKTISPFTRSSLIPHAIYALVLSSMLLLSAHVQIILRLAASMPMTYWAAAWLVVEHPKFGRWWIGWSVVWGVLSIVLWSTFLPPA